MNKILLISDRQKDWPEIAEALSPLQIEILTVPYSTVHHINHSAYSLFLLDCTNPTNEIFSAIEHLKATGSALLALVPSNPPLLRIQLLEKGITDYLLIPTDVLEIQLRVARYFEKATAPSLPAATSNSNFFNFYWANQLDFGLILLDTDLQILFINSYAKNLFDINSHSVANISLSADVFSETFVQSVQKYCQAKEFPQRFEITIPTAEILPIELGVSISRTRHANQRNFHYLITLKEITQTRRMREEMQRMDRLASLGVMASGIAHEIRNPLAGIKAMVQTFQEEIEKEDPKHEFLQRIGRLVNRIDELLKTLFQYARPSKPNQKFISLQSLLNKVFVLIKQNLQKKNIRYAIQYEEGLPDIYVDEIQTQQVLVNVLLNSIDAVTDNGEITISCKYFALNRHRQTAHHFPASAFAGNREFVEIRIRDNGVGISSEIKKQIFNPFFTTKSTGTGLGLSIAYQIIKENRGYIFFESEPNLFTECIIYLPTEPETIESL